MGFPTEVARARCTGRSRIPFEHGEFGIAALNHKPVTRGGSHTTADFASEFLERRHSSEPCILLAARCQACSL